MKTCTICKTDKNESEFCKNESTSSGLHYRCKQCSRLAWSNYSTRSKERRRESEKRRLEAMGPEVRSKRNRKKRLSTGFGLSLEDFSLMEDFHDGKCAICGSGPSPGRNLCIDHNHETGVIRGLLCAKCNHAIGLFGDNPDVLRLAAFYLEKPPMSIGRRVVPKFQKPPEIVTYD